jgi:5-methyltetrahydrofolate--homocysteine methyltransferase
MAVDLAGVLTSPMISDGAWGTQLDLLGCPPGSCREQWNLSHPDLVMHVAASYVQAGSQIILTNTFSANRFILERHNLGDKVEALNLAGVQISRQAAGERALVFGCMGPSGKMVIAQEVTEQDLYKACCVQAKALAAGGAAGIVCESMSELAEILTAVRAVKDVTGLPVVASMTFDTGPDLKTMMGVSAGDAAEQLSRAGVDFVGCNCGAGIDACIRVTAILRRHTGLPIWVKPNAGLPELEEGKVTYREGPEEFAGRLPPLLEAGANVVGGCCGTTPEHIAKMVSVVRNWQRKS